MSISIRPSYIELDIESTQGDTIDAWVIRFVNMDKTPKDISGIDFYYYVKNKETDDDGDAILSKAPADAVKTVSDANIGTVDTVSFVISDSESAALSRGNYRHVLKIVEGTTKRTWMIGDFRIR